MRSKLIVLCVLLMLVVTSCAKQAPAPAGPIVSQPDPAPKVEESRTGEEQVRIQWQHSFPPGTDFFEHVLANHPQGVMFGYWERQGQSFTFSRAILDPETGSVLQAGPVERVNPYCSWSNAILHEYAGEILFHTDAGTTVLQQFPEASGWLDFVLREDGIILLGYDDAGRFVIYLDQQGETRWSFRPPKRGPEEIFVFEAFGSREQVVDLGNGLLGVYGLTIKGLVALDSTTGQVVWDYHIPMEDRICAVSVGADGIWVGGLSYDYDGVVALIGIDGTVLREVEHSAPVTAIGALENKACWFMAGWGADGRNKIYLLEHDRLAKEVLEDIEFGVVPQMDNSFAFVDGVRGLLYRWQPGQDPEAYELPFYGSPSSIRVLGARDGMIIMQHKNETYAVSLGD